MGAPWSHCAQHSCKNIQAKRSINSSCKIDFLLAESW